jgi:hypothetical protein
MIPLIYTITDATESRISDINLKDLSSYLSHLIRQNEEDFRVHDQMVFNLIERMHFELKLNNFNKFNKLNTFLMKFYQNNVINWKNGDKIVQIYELIKIIMVCQFLLASC